MNALFFVTSCLLFISVMVGVAFHALLGLGIWALVKYGLRKLNHFSCTAHYSETINLI
jgi:hypothetical protein